MNRQQVLSFSKPQEDIKQMVDYLIPKLAEGGQKFVHVKKEMPGIIGREDSTSIVDYLEGDAGRILLIPQRFQKIEDMRTRPKTDTINAFLDIYTDVSNNSAPNFAVVFLKDGKTFFKYVFSENSYFKTQIYLQKRGPLHKYHDDPKILHKIITLTDEENAVRRTNHELNVFFDEKNPKHRHKGHVTYYQPKSKMLNEMIITFGYWPAQTNIDYDRMGSGDKTETAEEINKLFMWTRKIEKPGALILADNKLLRVEDCQNPVFKEYVELKKSIQMITSPQDS